MPELAVIDQVTESTLDQLEALDKGAYGQWFAGPTPGFIANAVTSTHDRRPCTIRTPEHTEELATFWAYLMDGEMHAHLVCLMRNSLPDLVRLARVGLQVESHQLLEQIPPQEKS